MKQDYHLYRLSSVLEPLPNFETDGDLLHTVNINDSNGTVAPADNTHCKAKNCPSYNMLIILRQGSFSRICRPEETIQLPHIHVYKCFKLPVCSALKWRQIQLVYIVIQYGVHGAVELGIFLFWYIFEWAGLNSILSSVHIFFSLVLKSFKLRKVDSRNVQTILRRIPCPFSLENGVTNGLWRFSLLTNASTQVHSFSNVCNRTETKSFSKHLSAIFSQIAD